MGQREALLHGKQHLEPVDLSAVGGPSEVMVRPLTEAEAGRVEAIRFGGLKPDIDMESGQVKAEIPDMGQFMECQRKARVQAVAYGLSHSGETWTVEMVDELATTSHGALKVKLLADAVYRISGMRAVEPFRLDGGPA